MKYILIFWGTLFPYLACAVEVPVVTGIETVIVDKQTKEYTVQLTALNVGEEGYNVLVSAGQQIAITHKHYVTNGTTGVVGKFEHGYHSMCSNYDDGCSNQGGPFYKGINSLWKFMGRPTSLLIRHVGDISDSTDECIGWVAAPYEGITWNFAKVASCVVVPPAEEWCSFDSPEIIFDHGEISLKEANGNSTTSRVSINCTVGTKIKLMLSDGKNYIPLTQGSAKISAQWQEHWQDLPVTLDTEPGQYNIPLKSTLEGIPEGVDGLISGNAVLVIEPQ